MQSMKESAANMAASAKAGMEKTKATVQEKVEKMTANDPIEKEMATEKKEERKIQAELNKQEAREHNAAAKQATAIGGHNPGYTAEGFSHSVTVEPGRPTGAQQMSALPGHGTGKPAGQVTEGAGINTGTGHNAGFTTDSFSHSVTGEHGRPTGAQQMSALPGQGTGQSGVGATGYGTGGAYT